MRTAASILGRWLVCAALLALAGLVVVPAPAAAQSADPEVATPKQPRGKRRPPAGKAGLAAPVLADPADAAAPDVRPQRPRRGQRRPAPRPPVVVVPTPAEQRRLILDPVRSWGFQLRLIQFDEVARAPIDLVVLDHALSAGRRFIREFTADEVRSARVKPDGSRRLVLAYLSVGEAERYRFYWKPEWYDPQRKPSWLGTMNTVWDGNYLVRFWDEAWQRLVFGSPDAYLERIQAAGFDGIYIDRADAHSEWAKVNPGAEKAMVAFIAQLAAAARERDPLFLVVMQNAEELLAHRAIVEAIDGIAKEDLYYGIDHKASPNDARNVQWSLQLLRRARNAGRKVMVVEYLADPAKAALARRQAEAERFVIHFTRRDLGELTLHEPDRPLAPPVIPAPGR